MTRCEARGRLERSRLRAAIGIAVSALVVGFAVLRLDWPSVLAAFASVSLVAILLAATALLACFLCFGLRWRELCLGGAAIHRRSFVGYYLVAMMFNDLLPLRAGDVMRIVLLHQRHGVTIPRGTASVVLDRLIDLAFALVLLLGLAAALDLSHDIEDWVLPTAIGFGAAILLGIVAAFRWRSHPGRWFHGGAAAWLAQLVTGLSVLRERRRLVAATGLTAAGWAFYSLGATILLTGMHIPVPWPAGLLIVVVTSLGGAIPSSPGALGVFHALCVAALAIWKIPVATAVAYAILLHGLVVSLHIGFGAAIATVIGVRYGNLLSPPWRPTAISTDAEGL